MESMHELREMLCEALTKVAGKGELSAGSLDTIHKLTDTIKNIDKIEMLEEGGYSEDGGWMARGVYGGSSYNRGGSYGEGGSYGSGGSYGQGDSYANGGSYARGRGGRGNSYDGGGSSYANRGKHYVRAHYSRDDGRAYMMEQLEGMMQSAGSEKERQAIQRCMKQLEEA